MGTGTTGTTKGSGDWKYELKTRIPDEEGDVSRRTTQKRHKSISLFTVIID